VKEPATESKENPMTTRLLKEFTEHLDAILGDRLNEMELDTTQLSQTAKKVLEIINSINDDDAFSDRAEVVDIDPRDFEKLMQSFEQGDENGVKRSFENMILDPGNQEDLAVVTRDMDEALDKIKALMRQSESTFEDEYGDEEDDLYSDEPEDTGFKGTPMYDQLGKLLDSQDSPKPINTVTTDDGNEHEVSVDQAKALRLLATTEKVKPEVRKSFLKDIQSSDGLVDFLDQPSYHEMAHLFVKRYLH
jgi:hypothetical protein